MDEDTLSALLIVTWILTVLILVSNYLQNRIVRRLRNMIHGQDDLPVVTTSELAPNLTPDQEISFLTSRANEIERSIWACQRIAEEKESDIQYLRYRGNVLEPDSNAISKEIDSKMLGAEQYRDEISALRDELTHINRRLDTLQGDQ